MIESNGRPQTNLQHSAFDEISLVWLHCHCISVVEFGSEQPATASNALRTVPRTRILICRLLGEASTDHQPSVSQRLKLGICCRSLIHFIEASQNLRQPVQLLRLRARYSIRSLSVQLSNHFC